MNFIKELGTLAIGSRLKNLSELMMKDMARIYKDQDVDFEPRWFTFFQLIVRKKEISVTEIARELSQTHPAVVQVINVLEKKKLIITRKDKSDQRKRLVRLSKKGKKLAEDLAPLWDAVRKVSDEIMKESDSGLLDSIAKIETVLEQKSTYQRIQEKLHKGVEKNIEFVPYQEKYRQEFRQLNEDWLNSYLEISDHDREILADPTNKIIKKNGEIFLLLHDEEVIGTYTLRKINHNDCELSKFTVKKEFRGRKLGKIMLEHAINRAKVLEYNSIILFTHHKLKEASRLYKKRGFAIISGHNDISDETGRCSVLLQLNINL